MCYLEHIYGRNVRNSAFLVLLNTTLCHAERLKVAATQTRPSVLDLIGPQLAQFAAAVGVPYVENPIPSLLPPHGPPRFRSAWPQPPSEDSSVGDRPVLVCIASWCMFGMCGISDCNHH